MKTLKDFKVESKRVLVRCDFNVPLSEKGEILDDFRIRQTIPTIEYLGENGAKIILISHLGRPLEEIQNQPFGESPLAAAKSKIQKFSLRPITQRLEKLLGKTVRFLNDCIGENVGKEIGKMKAGEVILLENLRFYKEEEENNEDFAKQLAKFGDIFIQEAFGALHRAHASIVGISKFLPSGAGFLLEREIKVLTSLTENPQKPLILIIGGKKVEDKAKMIDKISEFGEWILIGGLIQQEIHQKNIPLRYPQKIIEPVDSVEEQDIGPKTINLFKEKILRAKTVFWNGPLGRIEKNEFSGGSREIAEAIIKSGAFSVVGGGETLEFINKLNLAGKFSHVSTGGGALIEFLAGENLPGIEALKYGN